MLSQYAGRRWRNGGVSITWATILSQDETNSKTLNKKKYLLEGNIYCWRKIIGVINLLTYLSTPQHTYLPTSLCLPISLFVHYLLFYSSAFFSINVFLYYFLCYPSTNFPGCFPLFTGLICSVFAYSDGLGKKRQGGGDACLIKGVCSPKLTWKGMKETN